MLLTCKRFHRGLHKSAEPTWFDSQKSQGRIAHKHHPMQMKQKQAEQCLKVVFPPTPALEETLRTNKDAETTGDKSMK